jgi:hypothetical protein
LAARALYSFPGHKATELQIFDVLEASPALRWQLDKRPAANNQFQSAGT